MSRFALLLLLLVGAAPQLRVQAQLPDGNQAVVGQTLLLQVDVLTDSWFTSAPQLPELALPGVVVTPPDERAQHLTMTLDDTPFFGMRYTYHLTLREPGEVQIPALAVSSQPGNTATPLSARSQPLQISVAWPQAEGQNLLVASDVQLSQTLGSLEGLKVGDSLVRSVKLRATNALALMLPVTPLAEVKGLNRFVKTPQVTSLDNVSGQRIDSASVFGQRRPATTRARKPPAPVPALARGFVAAGHGRAFQLPACEHYGLRPLNPTPHRTSP